MILAINYGDERYRKSQEFNARQALKYGADKVIQYTKKDIPEEFWEKNKEIAARPRGGGYWIWKPYIIKMALEQIEEGDYVVYTDAGSALVNKLSLLLDAMKAQQTDIMVFCIDHPEREYSKRDAFVLMDCDKPEIVESNQICGTYIILRKSERSEKFIDDYLYFVQDKRIVTDDENVMGLPNYDGFVENRHDQTVLSLLAKKNGIKPFCDPSQWGIPRSVFPDEVAARSTYPQMIDSHRLPDLHSVFRLTYGWYRFFNLHWYVAVFRKWKKRIFKK